MPGHAVIVAGHAVIVRDKNLTADSSWHLLDFQRGEPPFYIGHVRAAVEAAAADPDSLLFFSGGPTRREAGPRSEAESYYRIAMHYAWFGQIAVAARAILEDFSRDSFENLLFGICRFREFAGRYPDRVTMVSWAFKERRFGLHREAIGYPAERFTYLGPEQSPRSGTGSGIGRAGSGSVPARSVQFGRALPRETCGQESVPAAERLCDQLSRGGRTAGSPRSGVV